MKKNVMGRGLGAIIGAEVSATPSYSTMQEIEIGRIIPNPKQPRTQFDQEALEELAESIKTLGVIQPITVKKEENSDNYIIISGERRWRASRMAGLETVPAYVREVSDQTLHEMALVENIQRQDLNAIEIALSLQRLIDECGLTQDALSDRVGKKRSTVANYMRLLKLPVEIQLAVRDGVISMGHAKAIAGAPEKEQLSLLRKCVRKGLSVRQTEELAKKAGEPQARRTGGEEEYPESYSRLVEQLERFFSQDISIKKGKNGGGKIIIEFNDDADINRFIDRFDHAR